MFVQHQKNIATEQQRVVSSKDFELEILNQFDGKLHAQIRFSYLQVIFTCDIDITNTTIQLTSTAPLNGIVTAAPKLDHSNILLEGYLDSRCAITKNGNQQIIWLMHDTIHAYNLIRLKAQHVLQLYRSVFYELKNTYKNLEFGKIPAGSKAAPIFADRLYVLSTQKFKHRYSNEILFFRTIQNLMQNEGGYFAVPLKCV